MSEPVREWMADSIALDDTIAHDDARMLIDSEIAMVEGGVVARTPVDRKPCLPLDDDGLADGLLAAGWRIRWNRVGRRVECARVDSGDWQACSGERPVTSC